MDAASNIDLKRDLDGDIQPEIKRMKTREKVVKSVVKDISFYDLLDKLKIKNPYIQVIIKFQV